MPIQRTDRQDLTFDDVLDEEYDKEHTGKFRRVKIENNTIHIRCEDPYGFWKVSLEKGNLPDYLKSSFTSFDQALRNVNIWLKTKKEAFIPSKELALDAEKAREKVK
jgi:hypothetical protein